MLVRSAAKYRYHEDGSDPVILGFSLNVLKVAPFNLDLALACLDDVVTDICQTIFTSDAENYSTKHVNYYFTCNQVDITMVYISQYNIHIKQSISILIIKH